MTEAEALEKVRKKKAQDLGCLSVMTLSLLTAAALTLYPIADPEPVSG